MQVLKVQGTCQTHALCPSSSESGWGYIWKLVTQSGLCIHNRVHPGVCTGPRPTIEPGSSKLCAMDREFYVTCGGW